MAVSFIFTEIFVIFRNRLSVFAAVMAVVDIFPTVLQHLARGCYVGARDHTLRCGADM